MCQRGEGLLFGRRRKKKTSIDSTSFFSRMGEGRERSRKSSARCQGREGDKINSVFFQKTHASLSRRDGISCLESCRLLSRTPENRVEKTARWKRGRGRKWVRGGGVSSSSSFSFLKAHSGVASSSSSSAIKQAEDYQSSKKGEGLERGGGGEERLELVREERREQLQVVSKRRCWHGIQHKLIFLSWSSRIL